MISVNITVGKKSVSCDVLLNQETGDLEKKLAKIAETHLNKVLQKALANGGIDYEMKVTHD